MALIIPKEYRSPLTIRETETGIKETRDYFQERLAKNLHLMRVSAPRFVRPETGLNDDLNGVERPVAFDIKETGCDAQIVHSLAKWKRYALKRYGFHSGEGLYTNMDAIRRDEVTDNIHSIYVDQWDWEKVISLQERNLETLRYHVRKVYETLKETERHVAERYNYIEPMLPDELKFVTTQELESAYPELSPHEREYMYTKKYGAIFLEQIGAALASGKPHDGRAPDYDDWSLNGDLIVNYPLLGIALEISSMGIRVDEETLRKQLEIAGCTERAEMPFHKALLAGELPYTIGGGIGQSRVCMYCLRKAHIGEVQASLWPEEMEKELEESGITLL